jgi:hypothetical protein
MPKPAVIGRTREEMGQTQGVARSPLQRRLQHHQHGHVRVLHADDRSEIHTLVGAYKSGFSKLASMG